MYDDIIRQNSDWMIVVILLVCAWYLRKICKHLISINKSVDREYQERVNLMMDKMREK